MKLLQRYDIETSEGSVSVGGPDTVPTPCGEFCDADDVSNLEQMAENYLRFIIDCIRILNSTPTTTDLGVAMQKDAEEAGILLSKPERHGVTINQDGSYGGTLSKENGYWVRFLDARPRIAHLEKELEDMGNTPPKSLILNVLRQIHGPHHWDANYWRKRNGSRLLTPRMRDS